ncbi:MAG: PD-(D/E)XK nuclease family protein [Bergeyella sp.]|nr:PD-(D/E)XK nuclease family protein [Bergeyella sp.]
MKFLEKVVLDILSSHGDLSSTLWILPGKRPTVFIKKILQENSYTGILPEILTIEDVMISISHKIPVRGVSLWLFAYDVYRRDFSGEDFSSFLKWFPTVLKDYDDLLKFSAHESEVLSYMFDEERIRNWGGALGKNTPRDKHLDFWKKMNIFLPNLKKSLLDVGLASSGILYGEAKKNIPNLCTETQKHYFFIGFNAFSPIEELLVRSLLRSGKADCYFHSDFYYMGDERQEAGFFLRRYRDWKEFNSSRPFRWIENEFSQPKNIKVLEVSGNLSQTKILPELFSENFTVSAEDTAVVLLDEHLLPATLEAVSCVGRLNITMGFPLKNMEFSRVVRNLFHLQKQIQKNPKIYYYQDLVNFLEILPINGKDHDLVEKFIREIRRNNRVYLSPSYVMNELRNFSYLDLLQPDQDSEDFLYHLSSFCKTLAAQISDDILYECVSYYEKCFIRIANLISGYSFDISLETLEILISQTIQQETLDFVGEPLEGLQIMGLLETRLLNFDRVILISMNEGKLPLGNTQNTYFPFDVRRRFGLPTYHENDSIYAYHFYRLIQSAKTIYLLYSAVDSGTNTGERSRFITQLLLESPHKIEEITVEGTALPVKAEPIIIKKTKTVQEQLLHWKKRVSPSHLSAYLYNPLEFYYRYVLKIGKTKTIEEEISQINYGNLVHYSLQYLYQGFVGKIFTNQDFIEMRKAVPDALSYAIKKLEHQEDFYHRGMNFVHKSVAHNVIGKIIAYDEGLVKNGDVLKIIDIERRIENIDFFIGSEKEKDVVTLFGFADRIDQLNGKIRLIDYKTAKPKNLIINIKDSAQAQNFLVHEKYVQALQLAVYLYCLQKTPEFSTLPMEAGIWSFASIGKGVSTLVLENCSLEEVLLSVRTLILEILNSEIPFEEKIKLSY